jgi:hypothetical protein
MDSPTLDNVLQRLDRLEQENRRTNRQCRRWRRVATVSLLGAVVLTIGGANLADVSKVIEAERFVLRDRSGAKRIQLSVDADGTARQDFCDKDGKTLMKLFVKPDGTPQQDFNDQGGRHLISLAVMPDGTVAQNLCACDLKAPPPQQVQAEKPPAKQRALAARRAAPPPQARMPMVPDEAFDPVMAALHARSVQLQQQMDARRGQVSRDLQRRVANQTNELQASQAVAGITSGLPGAVELSRHYGGLAAKALADRDMERFSQLSELQAAANRGGAAVVNRLLEGHGGNAMWLNKAVADVEKLILRDRDGEIRIQMSVAPDGTPVLAFNDKDGKRRVGLGVTVDGGGILNILDQNGKSVFPAP